MPDGLVRYQQTGDLHFVTFSCFHRLAYLGDCDRRELFERSLETVRLRYHFFVTGYVIMPEHVHLLVSEPLKGTLARALQALKLSVAVQRRERPFWQRRYYDFNVHSEQKRIEKLRYMHRNPVVRGLVAKPEDWKWSSFRHYATGLGGTVEIESFWTAARRGGLPEPLRLSPDAARPHISKARYGAPKSVER
jgi:putative transposase